MVPMILTTNLSLSLPIIREMKGGGITPFDLVSSYVVFTNQKREMKGRRRRIALPRLIWRVSYVCFHFHKPKTKNINK